MLLREFMRIYWEHCATFKSPQTTRKEKSIYKIWLKTPLGEMQVAEITAKDITEALALAVKQHKSPRTIDYIINVVLNIFKYAIKISLVELCPELKRPKIRNARIRIYTPEELKKVLNIAAIVGDIYVVIMFALHTGLRLGEIAALKHRDLNLEEKTISVTGSEKSSPRTIPLNQPLFEALLTYNYSGRPESFLIPCYTKTNKKDLVSLRRDTWSQTYHRMIESLGFNLGLTSNKDKLTFHSLRHTYASWLAKNEVPLWTISKFLGHKNIASTQRYAHLSLSHLREITSTVEPEFIKCT